VSNTSTPKTGKSRRHQCNTTFPGLIADFQDCVEAGDFYRARYCYREADERVRFLLVDHRKMDEYKRAVESMGELIDLWFRLRKGSELLD
jgi:hypothetical protein